MTTDAPKAGTPRPLESCTVDFDHVPADLQEAKEMLLRAKVDLAALREQLKECSAAFDRQQEQLDRNAEQIATLREALSRLIEVHDAMGGMCSPERILAEEALAKGEGK